MIELKRLKEKPLNNLKGTMPNPMAYSFSPSQTKHPMKPDKLRINDPMGDYDRDGVPNYSDCEPRNRKKQSLASIAKKAGSLVKTGYEKYKKYQAKAPEREEAKIAQLERKEKMYAIESKIAKHRGEIKKTGGGGGFFSSIPIRLRTEKERKEMGGMDFGFGQSKPKRRKRK